jgi:ribonuclease III
MNDIDDSESNNEITSPADKPYSTDTPEGCGNNNEIKFVEKHFGYAFKDPKLLVRALSHVSVIQEKFYKSFERSENVDTSTEFEAVYAKNKSRETDYQRLEFLGDAVLDLAISHLLIDAYPEASEGMLSKLRAALVNTSSLAAFAREIQLSSIIKIGKGEKVTGGAERESLLADVVEAIIGGIYRDAGFEAAYATVQLIFSERLKAASPNDPKTELQEILHAKGKGHPYYILEKVEGPEHEPTFVYSVVVEDKVHGTGKGRSKKIAQQNAAKEAIEMLKVSLSST